MNSPEDITGIHVHLWERSGMGYHCMGCDTLVDDRPDFGVIWGDEEHDDIILSFLKGETWASERLSASA